MLVALTSSFVTLTTQLAVLPLLVFAVIVALPTATAVTTPFFTVATLELLVDHVRDDDDNSDGVITTDN